MNDLARKLDDYFFSLTLLGLQISREIQVQM
jgi:hypothetical protein